MTELSAYRVRIVRPTFRRSHDRYLSRWFVRVIDEQTLAIPNYDGDGKYQLVERSSYPPRAGEPAPIPDWKKQPDWNAVLPKDDPARVGRKPPF